MSSWSRRFAAVTAALIAGGILGGCELALQTSALHDRSADATAVSDRESADQQSGDVALDVGRGDSAQPGDAMGDAGIDVDATDAIAVDGPIDTGTLDGSDAARDVASDTRISDATSDAEAASTCAPNTPLTLLPWAPPSSFNQGVCTTTQVAQYTTQLFSNVALPTSGSPMCDACLGTLATSNEYGPVILEIVGDAATAIAFNVGGCVAHIDGQTSSTSCGAQTNDLEACLGEACGACSMATVQGCETVAQADGGVCGALLSSMCQTEVNSDAESPCFPSSMQGYEALLSMWCGP